MTDSENRLSSFNDIESDCPREIDEFSSISTKNKRAKPSLPGINWEIYGKTGNKASFAWLFCLFSVLGLVVQQASLSTIVVRTTSARSTLVDGSFSSPILTSSSGISRERKMMQASAQSIEIPLHSADLRANVEKTKKQSSESKSTFDEMSQGTKSSKEAPLENTDESTTFE